MKHLINTNVYAYGNESEKIPENDGIELLTGYSKENVSDFKKVESVHLPYCVDWYGTWSGKRKLPDMEEKSIVYFSYGKSKKEIVENICKAIDVAKDFSPSYGIMHAGSANYDELFLPDYSETDEEVLIAFCEIMNEVNAKTKIPFRMEFENQWWPGLRFLSFKEYEILKKNLDFDDWGLCLDTGHLLVTMKNSFDEKTSVESLKKHFSSFPKEMKERIEVVHLHTNYSGKFIAEFDRSEKNLSFDETMKAAYRYVSGMDWHTPFSSPGCKELVDILEPKFVTHEMGCPEPEKKLSDYSKQRSFF